MWFSLLPILLFLLFLVWSCHHRCSVMARHYLFPVGQDIGSRYWVKRPNCLNSSLKSEGPGWSWGCSVFSSSWKRRLSSWFSWTMPGCCCSSLAAWLVLWLVNSSPDLFWDMLSTNLLIALSNLPSGVPIVWCQSLKTVDGFSSLLHKRSLDWLYVIVT